MDDKKQLTTKQFFRMALLNSGVLPLSFFPVVLSRFISSASVVGVLVGLFVVWMETLVYYFLLKPEVIEKNAVVKTIFLLRYWVRGGILLYLVYQYLRDLVFEDSNYYYLALPFVIACAYGAGKQMKQRGRAMELLFWWVAIPFVLILICAIFLVADFSITVQKPMFNFDFWRSVGWVVVLFAPMEYEYLHLSHVSKEERTYVKSIAPLVVVVLLIIVVSYVTIGVYGEYMTGLRSWSVLEVFRQTKLPGGVVNRLDIFVFACFLYGVAGLLTTSLHQTTRMVKMGYWGIGKWSRVLCAIAIFGVGAFLDLFQWKLEQCGKYILFVDIPVCFICLLCINAGKWKRQMATAALFSVVLFTFTGCVKQRDLENYAYMQLLFVNGENQRITTTFYDGDGNFENTAYSLRLCGIEYERSHGKEVDYNHLQGIIFGEQLLKDRALFESVLKEMRENREFPKTVQVYGATAAPAMQENLGEILLDTCDLVFPDRKENEFALGQMMKKYYERKTFEFPRLENKDDLVSVKNKYKIQNERNRLSQTGKN